MNSAALAIAVLIALPVVAVAQPASPGVARSGSVASLGAADPLGPKGAVATSGAGRANPVRGEPLGCLIEPWRVVDVGSPVIGVLDKVMVERGDVVRKDQMIAQLESHVERAAVALALSRYSSDADIAAAKSAEEFARRRQERNESLMRQNFISPQALDQSGTEERLAQAKLAQALDQRVVAAQEVKLARAQLALRTITSPLTGVVVERFMSAGERIEEKPIVRIAQVDPLRVEVILPASQYGKVAVGASAKVYPELPSASVHSARVTIVDRVVDAASNTFRIRLEMSNPGLGLPAGLRCKVEFES